MQLVGGSSDSIQNLPFHRNGKERAEELIQPMNNDANISRNINKTLFPIYHINEDSIKSTDSIWRATEAMHHCSLLWKA